MSQKQQSIEGRGGSYAVGDEVKKLEGALNPGDPGYAEAVRKAPLKDPERKGAFNRAPTYRDLVQHPKAPKAEKLEKPADPPTHTIPGGKR